MTHETNEFTPVESPSQAPPAPVAPRVPFVKRLRPRTLFGGAVLSLLLALGVIYLVPGCQFDRRDKEPITAEPLMGGLIGEPTVRVRVVTAAPTVTIEATGALMVGPGPGTIPGQSETQGQQERPFNTPLTIRRQGDAFLLVPTAGQAMQWRLDTLAIRPAVGEGMTINGATYPSTLVIHARPDVAAAAGSPNAVTPLDVINHVPIEQYLPGVISKELYATWQPETFRAQAIAARTYAIVQRLRSGARTYDLESTEASQMYVGTTANQTALEAVRGTRGIVLTWEGKLFPAYFSSCTGTLGQDASIAFPRGEDIPPLKGRQVGGWDALAPTYRWGPIGRDRRTLSKRLALWGQRNNHVIGSVGVIQAIEVTKTNSVGRPARFTIADEQGRRFDINCESLRIACNADGPGIPEVPAAAKLKSSHVDVRIVGESVQFTGQGHGHGVGMSQWGAEAIARKGYNAASILAFYYPGAALQRAY